jgi:metallo-beta-lactamase family protein
MKIQFLGASGTVTGSKYLVEAKSGGRVLVDCGLFQGWKHLRLRNWEPLPADVQTLDAVLLTHAHLDHSGYLPCLWRQGYRGPIYATQGTMDLCSLLLTDAGRLQEEDADYANRKGFSKHKPALPLFTEEEAQRTLDLFRPVTFDQDLSINSDFSAIWLPAGHIVGAASIYLKAEGKTVLFSGDLGRNQDLVMNPPREPRNADTVIIESTYGGRVHPRSDPIRQLGEAIRRTFDRDGVIVIPAFSVGRSQAILFALHVLKLKGVLRGAPVYLDSPMSIKAVEIYSKLQSGQKLSNEDCLGMVDVAQFTRTVNESKAIKKHHGPMIVISASGMATGGRVVHHIEHYAGDPRNLILFAGFQAGGTRGADLLKGAKTLRMHGKSVAIKAEVSMIDGLSAHADHDELLHWLKIMPMAPKQIFVTHGEPEGAWALAHAIEEHLGWKAEVPQHLEVKEI